MRYAIIFSSPLGVGLVRLSNINKIRSQRYFRPRVGMGWFNCCSNNRADRGYIFVPAWGWVGSILWNSSVGIGIFSSPSGDGLVQKLKSSSTMTHSFRPRLGLGWFPKIKVNVSVFDIFVPEWGWVGSRCTRFSLASIQSFRPRVGMGWFL